MKKRALNSISAEVLAAFLDGNATAQETNEIVGELSVNPELRELLYVSQLVDADMGVQLRECETLPMTAMAATCNDENYCCLECEKYVLRRRGVEYDDNLLLEDALKNGWQRKEGTALHNVGRHLEKKGFVVTRRYKATPTDIVDALGLGHSVIVAVDGGELLGCRREEIKEDILIGQMPDHTVVVLDCDVKKNKITIFDPNSTNESDVYDIEQFVDAWNDSKNYLVTIISDGMKTYNPKPIDLSDIELTEDLNDLREAIAENAHEVWAENRKAQGWSYGPKRDDEKLLHPDMVPYSQLPESEKEYDREMAMKTIKLLKKLGYDLVKREDTELYKLLLARIRNSREEFNCPHCLAEGIKTPIFMHDVFCRCCGRPLDIDWTLYREK